MLIRAYKLPADKMKPDDRWTEWRLSLMTRATYRKAVGEQIFNVPSVHTRAAVTGGDGGVT